MLIIVTVRNVLIIGQYTIGVTHELTYSKRTHSNLICPTLVINSIFKSIV